MISISRILDTESYLRIPLSIRKIILSLFYRVLLYSILVANREKVRVRWVNCGVEGINGNEVKRSVNAERGCGYRTVVIFLPQCG